MQAPRRSKRLAKSAATPSGVGRAPSGSGHRHSGALGALPAELLPGIARWLRGDRDDQRAARLACRALRTAVDATVRSLVVCVVEECDAEAEHNFQHYLDESNAQAHVAGKQVRMELSLC